MKRLIRKANTIKEETFGFHNGQTDSSLVMYDNNDKPIGSLEYSVYNDKPYIKMIEVEKESQRNGIATELLRELQSMFPGVEIDWGTMTGDGSALRDSITYEVENKELAPKFEELESLKKKLEEIEKKIDAGEDNGDEWNDTYDQIGILERELQDEKSTIRLVK